MSLTPTTSRNSFVKHTFDGSLAGMPTAGSSYPINQGDIVCWDTTLNSGAGGLRTVAVQADMAKYVGVAAQQTPIASLGDSLLSLEIWQSVIVKLKGTSGETYYHFQEVYWNETVDVQTISNSTNSNARTNPVGWVIIPQDLCMNGIYSVLAGAATDVEVWLNPKYPASFLV
jgi:hypothetical protein